MEQPVLQTEGENFHGHLLLTNKNVTFRTMVFPLTHKLSVCLGHALDLSKMATIYFFCFNLLASEQ